MRALHRMGICAGLSHELDYGLDHDLNYGPGPYRLAAHFDHTAIEALFNRIRMFRYGPARRAALVISRLPRLVSSPNALPPSRPRPSVAYRPMRCHVYVSVP